MKKKICFVTTGHPPLDDRIFWKFSLTLKESGYSVTIICSTQNINIVKSDIKIYGFNDDNLNIFQKINKLSNILMRYAPNIIICSEPICVIAAYNYKIKSANNSKIVLDVTEWYPENVLSKIPILKRNIERPLLWALNFLSSNLADRIIIGEIQKKKRYDYLAPFKKKIIIGYYPILKFFNYYPPKFDEKNFSICYAGLIRLDRGIPMLFVVTKLLAEKYSHINFTLMFAGKFMSDKEKVFFSTENKSSKNFQVKYLGWTEYPNISSNISDADICIDFRERNFIYNNSLPIKIFEYMAAGKPIIFSDIIPIKKEMDPSKFGFLVNPSNADNILEVIENYIINPKLLARHSAAGRRIIEDGKNWENEEKKLLNFLKDL